MTDPNSTGNAGEPATRAEALEVGSSTYFTGKPCKKGHVARRYTSNCTCLQCDEARWCDRVLA